MWNHRTHNRLLWVLCIMDDGKYILYSTKGTRKAFERLCSRETIWIPWNHDLRCPTIDSKPNRSALKLGFQWSLYLRSCFANWGNNKGEQWAYIIISDIPLIGLILLHWFHLAPLIDFEIKESDSLWNRRSLWTSCYICHYTVQGILLTWIIVGISNFAS